MAFSVHFIKGNTSLTDRFMASPATEADKAVLYAGERAFSVHLIKVNGLLVKLHRVRYGLVHGLTSHRG